MCKLYMYTVTPSDHSLLQIPHYFRSLTTSDPSLLQAATTTRTHIVPLIIGLTTSDNSVFKLKLEFHPQLQEHILIVCEVVNN